MVHCINSQVFFIDNFINISFYYLYIYTLIFPNNYGLFVCILYLIKVTIIIIIIIFSTTIMTTRTENPADASLSKDEAALYDRQIRLWGAQAQGR